MDLHVIKSVIQVLLADCLGVQLLCGCVHHRGQLLLGCCHENDALADLHRDALCMRKRCEGLPASQLRSGKQRRPACMGQGAIGHAEWWPARGQVQLQANGGLCAQQGRVRSTNQMTA